MHEAVIGAPVPALQNEQLLSGKARYLNDLKMPGMLVGKLLYSAHPCARITKLDVEAARSIPGVVAVLTHEDIPGENSYFYHDADQPLLVSDRVNYLGDAIIAVAAEDEGTASAALEARSLEPCPLMPSPPPEPFAGWLERVMIKGRRLLRRRNQLLRRANGTGN